MHRMSDELAGGRSAVWCSAASAPAGFRHLTQLASFCLDARVLSNYSHLKAPPKIAFSSRKPWRIVLSVKRKDCLWVWTPHRPPVCSAAVSGGVNEAPVEAKEENAWAESLQKRFEGSKAVRFQRKGNVVMMELKAGEGSSARLLLPQGLIISYKPSMWHGGFEEMLHIATSRVEGVPKVEGGIGISLSYADGDPGSTFSEITQAWEVQDILEEPSGTVQVMLICRIPNCEKQGGATLNLHYIITLSPTMLASAVAVSNIGRSTVRCTGSVFSHVDLSDIEGAYVAGLKGCHYSSISTASALSKKESFFQTVVSIWSSKDKKDQKRTEDRRYLSGKPRVDHTNVVPQGIDDLVDSAVETEDYAGLYDGMKRLYVMLNESCMLVDRGKRRSLIFRRVGFSDLWLFNPGQNSGRKSWERFVCIGPASVRQPVVLEPGQDWRAAQIIENLSA